VLIGRLIEVQRHVAWIVHEAGPTGFGLVRALRRAGFSADVIATSKLLRTVSVDAKSDRLDCRRLAERAAKDLLHKVRVLTKQEERDRQIVRMREQLVRKRRKARQQIKSFLLMHGIPAPEGLGNWSQAGATPPGRCNSPKNFACAWMFYATKRRMRISRLIG